MKITVLRKDLEKTKALFPEYEIIEVEEKKEIPAIHLEPFKPKQWPIMLLPMKLLAQPNDKGLGDIIARTIGPLGGNAFKLWYKTTFGHECGCDVRQENWNLRFPM